MPPNDDNLNENNDVIERRDNALRRALNTPPRPQPSQKTMDREQPAAEPIAQKPEPPAEAS
jgi:hypothetical protein